jgi:hypothetical protein
MKRKYVYTSLDEFYKNLWKWKWGVKEEDIKYRIIKSDLNEILKLNFVEKFVILMKNRMLMGFYRYGKDRKYNYIDYDCKNKKI